MYGWGLKDAHSKDDIIKAVWDAEGIVSRAADALGVSRLCLYNYLDDNPDVYKIVEDARRHKLQVKIDMHYENIEACSEQKESWATSLQASVKFLDKHGASRGWRSDVEQAAAAGAIETVELARENKKLKKELAKFKGGA